jgi:hypothetical protein
MRRACSLIDVLESLYCRCAHVAITNAVRQRSRAVSLATLGACLIFRFPFTNIQVIEHEIAALTK